MVQPEEIQEANRRSWNHATARHNVHKGDQTAFFRSGGSTLFPEEMALLGDLTGKTLVHLQCNSGQDTLSIARHLGAHVLGVDISDEAISTAETLSREAGIKASFMRSDLDKWFDEAQVPAVDVVFSSYGVVPWLSDLGRWARGVHKTLKTGGRFVLVEYHPLVFVFDDKGDWKPAFDYMGGALIEEVDGVTDYVGQSGAGLMAEAGEGEGSGSSAYQNPHSAYSFAWGLGETLSALLEAGLTVRHFREYPYTNGWKPFPQMVEKPGRRLYLPEGMPQLALMYSLVCQKPAAMH